MKHFLNILGFIISKLPERFIEFICRAVAFLICKFPNKRTHTTLANLYHCFPELIESQRKRIAFESAARMVEMAFFVIASPHMPISALKKRVVISDEVKEKLAEFSANPRPVVLMVPHFAMMETITMFPLLSEINLPKTGVFYRPFDNKGMEDWIRYSRSRFGIEMMSRKDGMLSAIKMLRENACVAVLFDQNAGNAGAESLFFGKVCSTSELAGILADKTNADVGIFYASRTGFWRSEIRGELLNEKGVENITAGANEWLENKLRSDNAARMDWLWFHNRWKRHTLSIRTNKNILSTQLERLGLKELPRNSLIFITPPKTLRDTIALMPYLRALRQSRADAKLVMLCPQRTSRFVRMLRIVDEVIEVPSACNRFGRYKIFRELSYRYPDIHLVFDDSLDADIESFLLGAFMNLSIQHDRKRRFMTFAYKLDSASAAEHIAFEYASLLKTFGMSVAPDFTPIRIKPGLEYLANVSDGATKIALVCGGDGPHAWSANKWVELASKLADKLENVHFFVYGGDNDSRTAYEVACSLKNGSVSDCSGLPDFSDVAQTVASSDIAIGTDCATSHIANMAGIPLVCLYGNTNLVRNSTVFDAPRIEILPENCPAQGGLPVELNKVDVVVETALKLLNK